MTSPQVLIVSDGAEFVRQPTMRDDYDTDHGCLFAIGCRRAAAGHVGSAALDAPRLPLGKAAA